MSLEEQFNAIPKITRCYIVLAVATTACVSLGFLSPMQLYLDFGLIWNKFQIWRLFTCFIFFGKFSMSFLFQLYILYKYSVSYEKNPFSSTSGAIQGTSADYMWMMLLGGAVMCAIGYMFSLFFMGPALVFMVLYVWSRRNATQPISFFGFGFKGIHLPWVMMAFSVLIGNSPIMDIVGVVTGHVYFFCLQVFPAKYGKELISTPQFLINFFEAGQYTHSYTPAGNQVRAPRPQGQHRWGQGNVLGGN